MAHIGTVNPHSGCLSLQPEPRRFMQATQFTVLHPPYCSSSHPARDFPTIIAFRVWNSEPLGKLDDKPLIKALWCVLSAAFCLQLWHTKRFTVPNLNFRHWILVVTVPDYWARNCISYCKIQRLPTGFSRLKPLNFRNCRPTAQCVHTKSKTKCLLALCSG